MLVTEERWLCNIHEDFPGGSNLVPHNPSVLLISVVRVTPHRPSDGGTQSQVKNNKKSRNVTVVYEEII